MTKFTIKYLFELYPTIDFEEEFVISQDVQEGNVLYNSQATKEILPHIFDTANKTRLIQTIKKRQYEVIFILSRNIDVARLSVGTVTVVTTDGETFLAHDIEVNYEKVAGSLDYRLTLKFYRYDTDIINHLSSDNAFGYSILGNVNTINYKVKNPSYVFNRVVIYSVENTSAPGNWQVYFDIPINDLTDTINIGDTYYLHTNNVEFNTETDKSGNYLNFAACSVKTATTLTFDCYSDYTADRVAYYINNLIIDHEKGYPDIPSSITVVDKEIEFDIFTFINPIYSNELIPIEGITEENGIEENDKFNSKDVINLKVWLGKDELYKAEYLNYALFNDITITFADGTVILPNQAKDIITKEDKPTLIDLFEYNIKIYYNNKMVNINR